MDNKYFRIQSFIPLSLVSGISTPISLTLSPLFKIIVSPSTTLVHLRVWELEQEADRDIVRKVRNKIFIILILSNNMLFLYHKTGYG